MNHAVPIRVLFYDSKGEHPYASVIHPRKFIIKSGFGAMKRRCWLELYKEDSHVLGSIGNIVEIDINGIRCFRGKITQRRLDSIDDPLSFYAEFDPEQEFAHSLYGTYENREITAILQDILQNSPLQRGDSFEKKARLHHLVFSGESLFQGIDLLAKLAGNWWWDVSEEGILTFRPPARTPDHLLALRRDVDTVNLWQTIDDLYGRVEMEGGESEGTTYDQIIDIIEDPSTNPGHIRVYVRSISTLDVFTAFRRAVMQQMMTPHYEHYIDWMGAKEAIQPGDAVCFRVDYLPLFPQERLFRVKIREIVYSHESVQTRLHVTAGNESSATYFHYYHVDYTLSRIGPFQLDVSALDSTSPLDSWPD